MTRWFFGKTTQLSESIHISDTEYGYLLRGKPSIIEDSIVIDNNDWFLLLDGFILNKSLLLARSALSWPETLFGLYRSYGNEFILKFKGSFAGILIDKKKKTCIGFVDPIGDRPIFYASNGVISSDFNWIVEWMNEQNYSLSPDIEGTKRFLLFGYMVDGKTHVKEITRVFPGNILDFSTMAESAYFRFSNAKPLTCSDEEIIEQIEDSFKRALKLEFEKDEEHHCRHLVDLSGGMDARTVCYIAKTNGFENITNIIYSQSNSYERKIAEQIAKDLNNEYFFYSLDSAKFIYDIDRITDLNYGLTYYAGTTGVIRILGALDNSTFGIEHTGILGDVYEGSFALHPYFEKPFIDSRWRFCKTGNLDIDTSFLQNFPENELYGFYTRGLLAGATTSLIRRPFFETFSPFQDTDWLNLYFSIPLQKRMKEKIYLKWLRDKHPAALKIPYARLMCNAESSKLHVALKTYPYRAVNKYLYAVLNHIGFPIETNSRLTMNPFEYWWNTNAGLRKFVTEYFEDNLERLSVDRNLYSFAKTVYAQGSLLDKTVVMTVLSVYKRYFC